ncbi:aldehyde dehydrogenase family protein [Microbacterium sp. NPDC055910]|uniref:aldehyde dehydrogenase family protein n=1 Tax=Microbacterium sp. NPDC055910 TaxID=3345659 RepID=UPI0035D9CEB2
MTITAFETLDNLSASARALIEGPLNWIGGEWEEGQSSEINTVLNPSTGGVLRSDPHATPDQARRAVRAAREAFDKGPWGRSTPAYRAAALNRLADLMDEYYDELVEIIITEVGTPVALARGMQVSMPVANIRWAADMALKGPRGGYEEPLLPSFQAPASSSVLQRVPAGVVAGITGYNFPINSVVWKLGPGLAAGCTLVFKSSERTPLSTRALMKLVEMADIPMGVVNFVSGLGDVGEVLTTDPAVDMVMFTGSLKVGKAIQRAAAETTKKTILELGGKSANILLPTVSDFDAIVEPSIMRFARNSGQGCGSTTRMLVPRAQYDDFAGSIQRFVGNLKVGLPWDEENHLGPLIREEQRQFVAGFVDRAVDSGAEIIAGGGATEGLDGYFYNPTVVGAVDNTWEIAREELFGPVGVLIPYDTVEEAIDIAHDSPYGLHAAVYGDPTEAYGVATRLRTGAVSINGGGYMRPDAPWGGFKLSGYGREMGADGFQEFFQVKHIQWPIR